MCGMVQCTLFMCYDIVCSVSVFYTIKPIYLVTEFLLSKVLDLVRDCHEHDYCEVVMTKELIFLTKLKGKCICCLSQGYTFVESKLCREQS